MFKKIVKITAYLFLVFALLLSAVGATVWLMRDKIIQAFIQEANQYLAVPVQIGSIDVTIWEKFPEVALRFNQLKIGEEKNNLADLKTFYITFDAQKIWKGEYEIQRIFLEDGSITLHIDKNGKANYIFWKTPEKTTEKDTQETQKIQLDLQAIALKNIQFRYKQDAQKIDVATQIDEVEGTFAWAEPIVKTALKGNLKVEKIAIKDDAFFRQKNLQLNTALQYELNQQLLTFLPSDLQIEQSEFSVEGNINAAHQQFTELDVRLQAVDANLQTLLSLLPTTLYEQFKSYQSEGTVSFGASIKGKSGKAHNPTIEVNWGCHDVSFFHTAFNKRLENINMKGYYTNGEQQNTKSSVIELKNLTASLNRKTITADFYLKNFDDPYIQLSTEGNIDLADLLGFYPIAAIQSAEGELGFQLIFKGKINQLKDELATQNIQAEGEINLLRLGVKMSEQPVALEQLNGTLLFNKNDMAISNIGLKLNGEKYQLNGFCRNLAAWLLFENEPLAVEATLNADQVDVDKILALFPEKKKEEQPQETPEQPQPFSIPKQLYLQLQAKTQALRYQKYLFKDLTTSILIDEGSLAISNTVFGIAGGKIAIMGVLKPTHQDTMGIAATLRAEQLEIDSLFELFDNFGQTTLTQQNIKGKLSTNIDAIVYTDRFFSLDKKRLKTSIEATIRKGQLINFEPVKALGKFIKEEKLRNLTFEELKNTILIENEVITIPDMNIQSNIIQLGIAGTHTFNQEMNYQIRVPWNNFKRRDKDEQFGKIAQDTVRGSIYLQMTGTPDNPKISYNTQMVKQRILEGLQREKEEFKAIFKKRPKMDTILPKKSNPATKEEFFDF
jgi:uncharacterized protein YhdP